MSSAANREPLSDAASFEVFNDDYQQIPLEAVAERGRRAAVWLGEEVLRRAVPLPNAMRLRRRESLRG
jgi:hypothetical protein